MDLEDFAYQCKLCEDKFKTTADLQKHRRLNHRNSTPTTTTVTVDNVHVQKSEVKTPPPVQNGPRTTAQVVQKKKEVEVTGHRHGTRYSTKATNNRNDNSFGARRHITCASCSHNFDTKDPVVAHLLRQSRNENATLKCPFCVKLLFGDKNAAAAASVEHGTSPVKQKEDSSCIPTHANLSMRRKSKGSSNGEDTAKEISQTLEVPKADMKLSTSNSKVVSTPVRQPSLRVQQKRKLSSPLDASTPNNKFSKSQSSSIARTYTPVTSASTPAAGKFSQTSESTPAPTTFVPVVSDQLKHSYELMYRQPFGKGSRGGSIGRRTSRSDRNSEDDSTSSAETPLKVSVLINDNPIPSATRLAVPKGKHFKKGDIRCPYCGFEAKSVREIQFHVNTHMAKSYPCEFCSHIYRSKQAVTNHTEKYHPNEVSNLRAHSSVIINNSNLSGDTEDDHLSMSNYSSSMASDCTETRENLYDVVNQSRDSDSNSNMENHSDFPVATIYTSYYTPEAHQESNSINSSFGYDKAYISSIFGALQNQHQAEQEFFMPDVGRPMEKVVDLQNF